MKDPRLWLCGGLFLVVSVLIGNAQLAPNHVPYKPEATNEKHLKRAAHNLRKVPPIPAVATKPKQLECAESTIAKYYDKVGKLLTATLADEEIPIRERVRAAKRLGIMKYPPAISMLIRHNQLLDPDVHAISDDWTVGLPCLCALIEYGDAAVPQVIDAYLEEENRPDRSRLYSVISTQSTRRAALIYANGLASDAKDKDRSNRLEWLIKRLSQ